MAWPGVFLERVYESDIELDFTDSIETLIHRDFYTKKTVDDPIWIVNRPLILTDQSFRRKSADGPQTLTREAFRQASPHFQW